MRAIVIVEVSHGGAGIWDLGFGIRDSGFGNRESGIGNRESGIGNRESLGRGTLGFCWQAGGGRYLAARECLMKRGRRAAQ
ncbi:hypothetical protein BVV20_17010 [Xanthomonas oryzae pv. oryzae]|nr:hypothetical protein BVV20_17010 [Xanthomonas oryzae pv. oryzae]